MSELIYLALTITAYAALFGASLIGAEALLVLIAMITIVGNVIVGKLTLLFGFQLSPSAGLAVCLYWIGILLNQYSGMRVAKRALWYNLSSLLFLTLVGWLTMHLIGGIDKGMDASIATMFTFMPGVLIGAAASFTASYLFTIFAQRRLRKIKGRDLSVPVQAVIVAAANLIDITIFCTVAYATSGGNTGEIIMSTWTMRMIALLFGLPVIFLIRKLYKKGNFPLIKPV